MTTLRLKAAMVAERCVCDRAATERPGLGTSIHMRDVTARSLSTRAAAATPIDGHSRSEAAAAASRVSPALAAGAVVAPPVACRVSPAPPL